MGNPGRYAPVPSALTGDCIFRSLQVPVRQPCHRFYYRQNVNYPDDHGLSVRIPHVCDHVGRYCGKIGSKQKREMPRENMCMAYRDEYSKRKCGRRCVVCNEESIWGSFMRWRRRSARNRLSWKRLKLTCGTMHNPVFYSCNNEIRKK